jgi:hypothetical protein
LHNGGRHDERSNTKPQCRRQRWATPKDVVTGTHTSPESVLASDADELVPQRLRALALLTNARRIVQQLHQLLRFLAHCITHEHTMLVNALHHARTHARAHTDTTSAGSDNGNATAQLIQVRRREHAAAEEGSARRTSGAAIHRSLVVHEVRQRADAEEVVASVIDHSLMAHLQQRLQQIQALERASSSGDDAPHSACMT